MTILINIHSTILGDVEELSGQIWLSGLYYGARDLLPAQKVLPVRGQSRGGNAVDTGFYFHFVHRKKSANHIFCDLNTHFDKRQVLWWTQVVIHFHWTHNNNERDIFYGRVEEVFPLYSIVFIHIFDKTRFAKVIDLLSSNYIAVAQMANLMAEWLILAGAEIQTVQQLGRQNGSLSSLYIYLLFNLWMYASIFLSIYLSFYLSIYLSILIYLFI